MRIVMMATGRGMSGLFMMLAMSALTSLGEAYVARCLDVIRQRPQDLDEELEDQADVRDWIDEPRRSDARGERDDAGGWDEAVVDDFLNFVRRLSQARQR